MCSYWAFLLGFFFLLNILRWSIVYSLYSVLLPPLSPLLLCSLHRPIPPPWSFIPFLRLTLLPLSSSTPSSPLHPLITLLTIHLIVLPLAPSPTLPSPLPVFCVSRILTVTQIFWPWAVPWGWAAVLAHRSEVLYNVHAAPSLSPSLSLSLSLSLSWLII